jgi:hypothetical protein
MKASVKPNQAIASVFLDIGGALLSDGWDHHARKRAAKHFKLEWGEMEKRHSLNFATYEEGKLTLEEYLEAAWSSTESDRSRGLSSSASCWRNRSLIPR